MAAAEPTRSANRNGYEIWHSDFDSGGSGCMRAAAIPRSHRAVLTMPSVSQADANDVKPPTADPANAARAGT
jgi:hypothetical protein